VAPDAPVTVWVKRTDVPGAQYAKIEGVDLQQTVSKFKARWVAQAKLDIDPSLAPLRLVQCGSNTPTFEDEPAAAVLDNPRLTLNAAGITDGCSLLAFVAGALRPLCPSALPPADGTRSRDGRGRAPLSFRAQVGRARAAEAAVKKQLKGPKSAGQLTFTTAALGQVYHDALTTQALQQVPLPTWFAPDPAAPALAWSNLLPGASEADVQQFFERLIQPLAAASRAPTLVLEGRSSAPSFGTRKPDLVAYTSAAGNTLAPDSPAAASPLAVPSLRSEMHIGALGELKLPRAPSKSGMFTDEEKGRTLNFAEALVRSQPWRAHGGSLARVVVFLSDGVHVVFFECTFRVEVRELALHVDLHAARESAPCHCAAPAAPFWRASPWRRSPRWGASCPNVWWMAARWRCRRTLALALRRPALRARGAVTPSSSRCTTRRPRPRLRRWSPRRYSLPPTFRACVSCAAPGTASCCWLRLASWHTRFARTRPRRRPRALRRRDCGRRRAQRLSRPRCRRSLLTRRGRARPSSATSWTRWRACTPSAGCTATRGPPTSSATAGLFFLADLGSAARVGDAAAAAGARPWALQYGPLAALRAAAEGGAPLPVPEPAHDFEQVARLVYATQAHDGDTLPVLAGARKLCDWWALRDGSLTLQPLLAAAAASAAHPAGGGAQRVAFKALIRLALVR